MVLVLLAPLARSSSRQLSFSFSSFFFFSSTTLTVIVVIVAFRARPIGAKHGVMVGCLLLLWFDLIRFDLPLRGFSLGAGVRWERGVQTLVKWSRRPPIDRSEC